jgi:hypothetical protein
MKGINLKKLGAIVAGSALLAGSVAFAAPVSFQNVELVNSQGQPVAKVVVGSKAALSDAVAAARIAQRLANSAFVEKEYTAQVQGQDQLSCSISGQGQATCTVSNKQVTLEVTVPGLKSTAQHNFGLLIAEATDKEPLDRDSTGDLFNVNDNFNDPDANPFQNQIGSTIGIGTSPYQAYRIDGSNVDALRDFSVKGSKFISGLTESQRVYIQADTRWSNTDDAVKTRVNELVYQIVIGPDKQGLPLCPGKVDTDVTNSSNCAPGDRIEAARVPIMFLGSQWYITEASIAASDSYDFTDKNEVKEAATGSKIKLAKEAKYGIVNVGSSLETDDGYKVTLGDIAQDTHEAILSIYDSSGNLVSKDQVAPGDSKDITLSGGKTVRVHVYQTAPGYTLTEKWAEMAILKDEIELEQGEEFIKDSDSDYEVHLGVTNKIRGPTTADAVTHLKEIILYATGLNKDLGDGDSLNIADLANYSAYTLKYNGLKIDNTDTLKFEVVDSPITTAVTLKDGTSTMRLSGKVIKITSKDKEGLRVREASDGTTTGLVKRTGTIYYVVKVTAASGTIMLDEGDLFFKGSDDNKWYYVDVTDTSDDATTIIDYSKAGSNVGAIYVEGDPADGADGANLEIYYVEAAGKQASADAIDAIGFVYDSTDDKLKSVIGTDEDSVSFFWEPFIVSKFEPNFFDDAVSTLTGLDDPHLNSFGYDDQSDYSSDDGFTTLRGTRVTDNDDSRTLKVPSTVAIAHFTFAPSSAATAQPNTQEVTLREGDTTNVGEVTIKAKSISVQATPSLSGAGAGAGVVSGLDKLSAVIVSKDGLEKVSSLKAATRVPVNDALVVTDEQAASVATKIVVGGPAVNSAAKDALSAAGLEITPDNNVVVKAVDSKTIVVAGYTAEDTVNAVNQFLAQLSG